VTSVQLKAVPCSSTPENAAAHALFQTSGIEARRIAVNIAKMPELLGASRARSQQVGQLRDLGRDPQTRREQSLARPFRNFGDTFV
jgi:hypothetical protein